MSDSLKEAGERSEGERDCTGTVCSPPSSVSLCSPFFLRQLTLIFTSFANQRTFSSSGFMPREQFHILVSRLSLSLSPVSRFPMPHIPSTLGSLQARLPDRLSTAPIQCKFPRSLRVLQCRSPFSLSRTLFQSPSVQWIFSFQSTSRLADPSTSCTMQPVSSPTML